MIRERGLNENAVHIPVGVELLDEIEQLLFRGRFREHGGLRTNSEPAAGSFLHADVNLRSGIFAHSNEDEAGKNTARIEPSNTVGSLSVNLFCYGASIDEVRNPHQGTVSSLSMAMTGVLGQRSSSISSPVTMMRLPCTFLRTRFVEGL